MKLKHLLLFAVAFAALSFTACGDDDDDDKIPAPNIPTAVVDAFKAKYPDVNLNTVRWETEGQYIKAEYKTTANMKDIEAWFTTSGEWKMTETDFGKDLFLIPTAINLAFNKTEYATWTIDDINLYEYPDATKDFYLIEVEKTGQSDTGLYFKPDGTLIKTAPGTEAEITPDTVI